MQGNPALNIAMLTDKDLSQIRNEALSLQENETPLGNTTDDDKKAFAAKRLKPKREKPDYRLYPLYVSIKAMEKECADTMDELLVLEDDGSWTQTETYHAFAQTSAENAEMLKQMEVLWMPIVGKADKLKAQWIKEKVIQGRYSRRGQEYTQKLNDLVDDLFTLGALCVNVLIALNEV